MITEDEAKRSLIGGSAGAISAAALLAALGKTPRAAIQGPWSGSDYAKVMALGATLGAGTGYLTAEKTAAEEEEKPVPGVLVSKGKDEPKPKIYGQRPIDDEGSVSGRIYSQMMPYHSGVYGGRRGKKPAYDQYNPTVGGELATRGIFGAMGATGGALAGAGLGLLAGGPTAAKALAATGALAGGYGGQAYGGYDYKLHKALQKIKHREGRKAGLVMSGMKPEEAEKMANIDENTALYLAQQLGPEKVAKLLEQVEQEKVAAYHYELGQIMAAGFRDEMDKEASMLHTIRTGPARLRRAAGNIVGRGAEAVADLPAQIPTEGRGALTKAEDWIRGPTRREQFDAFVEGAGALTGKDKRDLREGAKGLAMGAGAAAAGAGALYGGSKLMKGKKKDDSEKQSGDDLIYAALEVLDNAGVDIEKLAMKGELPEELKKHKYPKDKDGDGEVNEAEKKSSEADLYRALAVCAEHGIHFQE